MKGQRYPARKMAEEAEDQEDEKQNEGRG